MNKFSINKIQVEEESTILDPYNKNNIVVTKKDIVNILKKGNIDIPIRNLNLYIKAFTHKSYSIQKNQEQLDKNKHLTLAKKPKDVVELKNFSYERLEFLGDSILGAAVTSYLFRRYYDQN